MAERKLTYICMDKLEHVKNTNVCERWEIIKESLKNKLVQGYSTPPTTADENKLNF